MASNLGASHVPAEVVIDFDHHSEQYSADPPAMLHSIRERCPVAYSPYYDGFWLLTRYSDIAAAARDDATFSSDHDLDGTRRGCIVDGVRKPFGGTVIPPVPGARAGMIEMDPPEFSKYRRLLNPLFSPHAVDLLRPRILEITTHHIDRVIKTGACDLILDLVSPIPATVTMEQLGLPLDRCEGYAAVHHAMLATPYGTPERDAVDAAFAAQFSEYAEVMAARRARPADDWISVLVRAEIDGAPIPDPLILEHIFLILAGGIDTTTQLLAHALLWLHRHPDDRDALRAHPENLGAACEEFLRWASPVQMFARTVTADHEIAGQPLHEGDRVMLCWAAANRDPEVFEDPDEVHLDRFPNRHMAFGLGVHRCIGSNFARAQFEIIIGAILERMPGYVVDEAQTVGYQSKGVVNGIVQMPCTFSASRV